MKRHPALVTYSSDHHQGLVWARKFSDISDETAPDALQGLVDEFLGVWDSEIDPHFTKEEEILLPLYAISGDPGAPAIQTMLEQHITLRRDIILIRTTPTTTLVRQIGDQLREHIRHEEQTVFPLIEEKASEEILQQIQHLSE